MPLVFVLAQGALAVLARAEQPRGNNAEAVKVTYVTEADRLNVASGGGSFPPASLCLLQIEGPSTTGTPDQAGVTLVVEPQHEKLGWWARKFGKAAETPAPAAVRNLVIPTSELQTLLSTLETERFYVRSKPLTTDVFIAVESSGKRFAKDFYSLPQLDALVLRTLREGEVPPTIASSTIAQVPAQGYPTTVEFLPSSANQCRRLPPVSEALLR
ncbi:hypothetical protein [Botrimarina hoheduenensis]|uniref:Uncharacterized protein n=1 Tax=Botrimarina hoheduenensis TaxID=2528000 RepID=A0A5C5VVE7_9BACT|nr:hypothetical protein [Botrimarina hoheduenensis]TWT42574.1 hypothetical protein Pla111_28800 [Botrimarina hoheduenensis]